MADEKKVSDSNILGDIQVADMGSSTEKAEPSLAIRRRMNKRYMMYFVTMMTLNVMIIFLIFVAYYYRKYVIISGQQTLTSEEQIYVNDVKSREDEIFGYFNMSLNLEVSNITINNTNIQSTKDQIKTLIEGGGRYIDKKELLTNFLKNLDSKISESSTNIDKIKSDIGTYGFLPQELNEIIKENEIQRTFLSVEAIKYFTALQIYSYFDSFIEAFEKYSGGDYTIEEIQKKMDFFIKRGERDTKIYLQNCYLNPFEPTSKCSYIKDFENYYINSQEKGDFGEEIDYTFLKRMLEFIKEKLEISNFATLAIIFDSIDTSSNNISFTIKITIFEDDKQAFKKRNIITPNEFIVKKIIDLLRQSHMIVGEAIELPDIKISKEVLRDSSNEYNVDTSEFKFSLPIQKNVEKEIYDYIYKK